MLRLAPSMLLLAVLAGPAAAAEGQLRITEVEIVGAELTHPDRVRFRLQVRAGHDFSEEELHQALSDDVRAIEQMGPFTGTKAELVFSPDGRQAKVVYRFRELPYVTTVAVEGLGYFQEETALKALATRKGSYLNPLIVENDRLALQRLFQDKGHRRTVATVSSESAPGGVRLVFRVDLGNEVEVGRIIFEGLPQGVRPRHFQEALFNNKGQPYLPDLMAQDASSVRRTLQDLGWLDARVVSTSVEVNDYIRPLEERRRNGPELAPDGVFDDRVVIIYRIEPGERYHLGSVSFVGNTVADAAALRQAFANQDAFGAWVALPEGHPFVRKDIDGATERSRRLISNQGYARCDIRPDKRVDTVNKVVHLALHVDEGSKYRIGRVDIHGNQNTREAIVRRAMSLNPGDWWNDDRVDESKRQIERTDLYKQTRDRPLRIVPRFPEDRPDEADLLVDVNEDNTGSLSFQMGYSTAYGVFGEVKYTESNFDPIGLFTQGPSAWRGAGHILEVSLYGSADRTSFGTTWTNPHLMDGPYSLSGNLSRSDSQLRSWDELRITSGANIGRRFFNNDLGLNLGYVYTDLDIRSVDDDAPDDAVPGKHFENTFTFAQTYDRLNSRRSPTSGWLVGANQSVTGFPLPASEEVFEYAFRGEGYLPMALAEDGGVTFLHAGARWRQVMSLNNEGVPFFDRYVGGGPAPRHRGFDYNKLGPKEINSKGYVADTGGDRELQGTVELVVPLQGTNDGVRGILFLDHGTIWGEGETASWGSLRTAAGVGVRFPIQLPVALDFAWLLDKRDGESAAQIHFGLGMVRF